MPARKSRWQEQHATCQETIIRQRTENEVLRQQVADLTARIEAMEDKVNSITIGPGGALYGG